MTDLLKHICSLSNFSDQSWEILKSIIVQVKYQKGEVLVQPGKICNSLVFISRGLCRAFHVKDGLEINTRKISTF